eukprot:m.126195 g.126195  ORF g.126195 m.126195 type:complete len:572 (+) comp37893_c1_seq3:134-1849(+)
MNRLALIYVALLCVVVVIVLTFILCPFATFPSVFPGSATDHDNGVLMENSSPSIAFHSLAKKQGTNNSKSFGIAWSLLEAHLQIRETSPVQTKVELLTSTFVQYKPIRLLIHARNDKDQSQRTGGDLFHAVLKSQPGVYKEFQYQSGSVYDFDNGSYLVEFVPYWAGPTSIELTLGLPSKFRRATITNRVYGYEFSCSYSQTAKVGKCHFYTKPPPSSANDKRRWCKINAPEYGYYVSCELPTGITCDKSQACKMDKSMGSVGKSEFESHKPTFVMVRLKPTVSRSSKETTTAEILLNSNPDALSKESCAVFFKDHQNYHKVVGSWSGKSFTPGCIHHCDSLSHAVRCMQDSTWYFIGDSTVRQTVELLDSMLTTGKPDHVAPPNWTYLHNRPPKFYPSCNCTMHFHFHGFPISTRMRTFQNFTDKTQRFAAQTVDLIPGRDSDVLVIGSVQHFTYMPYDGFHKRMEATRDALIRLHRRAPNMTIIWRGSNARENHEKDFFTNNAKLRFYSRVAASIMKDVPSIHIIDVWKMFFGYPSTYEHISHHYSLPAITELLRLMAGIACPKEDCRK